MSNKIGVRERSRRHNVKIAQSNVDVIDVLVGKRIAPSLAIYINRLTGEEIEPIQTMALPLPEGRYKVHAIEHHPELGAAPCTNFSLIELSSGLFWVPSMERPALSEISDIRPSNLVSNGWDVLIVLGEYAGEVTFVPRAYDNKPGIWGDVCMWASESLVDLFSLDIGLIDEIEDTISDAIMDSDVEPSPKPGE